MKIENESKEKVHIYILNTIIWKSFVCLLEKKMSYYYFFLGGNGKEKEKENT